MMRSISNGVGESGNRRVGESGCGCIGDSDMVLSSWPNEPLLGLIGHSYNLAKHLFIALVDLAKSGLIAITAAECNLDRNLRFGRLCFGITKLRYKRSLVAALAPGFCQVRAYRTR